MSDSSWRYPEQRQAADQPPVRRERRGPMAPGEDGFADLYRAPAGGAMAPGGPRRVANGHGGRNGQGGHRRGDAYAGEDRAARADGFGDDGSMPVRSQGWGMLAGRYGVLIMTAGAAVGAFVTILANAEPGTALGVALVAGALAGALAVHPRAAYRLIPAPAIAGFVAAMLAGVVHDRAADTSHTLLAINAFGWMAGGFVAMAAGTSAALVIAVARGIWYARRRRHGGDLEAASWDNYR